MQIVNNDTTLITTNETNSIYFNLSFVSANPSIKSYSETIYPR